MRQLILSVDYEVFGNGTGDVRQHVVNPTERMAQLCEEQQVPLTVFLEVEEFIAFHQNAKTLEKDLGYNPAERIGEQIRRLAQKGHDVQLHLHPEWYQARYDAGRWILRSENRTVDDLFETQEETTQYIAERKAVLENLSGKPVRAYRAGAFSAQPGRKLLAALEANHIFIDSSVVKGLTRSRIGLPPSAQDSVLRPPSSALCFDYRNAPSAKGPWRVSGDVVREDASGRLWEFPIYSIMGRRWQQMTFGRLKAKFSNNVPKDRQREMINQLGVGKNPVSILKFLCQPVPIKLDFHNVCPGTLVKMIRDAPKPENGEPDVLVLIGHTKEHVDDRPFAKFLQLVAADSNLKVVTLSDVANMLTSCGSSGAGVPPASKIVA